MPTLRHGLFTEIITYIKNVDLLYHEATFAESERNRAEETFHSTAQQAAEIALAAGVKTDDWTFSSRYNGLKAFSKRLWLFSQHRTCC